MMISDSGKQFNELSEIKLSIKASIWHDSKEEASEWLQKLIRNAFYHAPDNSSGNVIEIKDIK